METHRIKLTPIELAELDRLYPRSRGSGDIGRRAVEIARRYFASRDSGLRFVTPPRGADLAFVPTGESTAQIFEIKGTADSEIAWQQLKVSSQSSHDLLASGVVAMLRVTNVYGNEPIVYELRHGRDFRLEPEARWTVRPIRGA